MKMPPESKMNHRRSIRLRGYDYSREGGYFITLCAQNREWFFEPGPVQGMLKSFWDKLSEKFPMVQVDKFIVMPNHVHGIIMIGCRADEMGGKLGRSQGAAPTLGRIIGWYKTMTTNAYINGVKIDRWEPFNGTLRQRNYFEHIIRNEEDLNNIRQYIIDNPIKWEEDENNPKRAATWGRPYG